MFRTNELVGEHRGGVSSSIAAMTTATQRQYGRTSLRAKDGTAAILSTARQVGPLISTITDDVNAVQDFVSTSLLDILIDGSGKSTLVSLIPGFYDPVSGTVSIDGKNIRDFTVPSLRRRARESGRR